MQTNRNETHIDMYEGVLVPRSRFVKGSLSRDICRDNYYHVIYVMIYVALLSQHISRDNNDHVIIIIT